VPTPSERDTAVLQALASPVRQDLLDALARGPATSAMLARLLSSNTGVLSYHLRELGKAGLIERDEERSRGREVYWRLSEDDARFDDPAISAQPELAQAAIDLTLHRLNRSVRGYLGRPDLDPAWRDAALFSRSSMRLTVDELAQFSQDYLKLLRRWSKRQTATPDAELVQVALFAYPESPAPEGQPA
jgi:DNA-binding transcriptional ArsR family regulator